MADVSRKTVCDAVNCHEHATMHWSAQWSLVDFGEWYACDDHVQQVGQWLAQHRPNGHEIVGLQAHYWDLET